MPSMSHPAELSLHQYMSDAVNGKSTMSEEVIEQVGNDVKDALRKQFGGGQNRGADQLANYGLIKINLK